MSIRNYTPPQVDVSDARFERPWNIDMEAFFSFSFDMAECLLDLEAQHVSPEPFDDELFEAATASAMWM